MKLYKLRFQEFLVIDGSIIIVETLASPSLGSE